MRIAVTGASGFVGSHLVPALRQRGHDVRPLTRAVTGDIGPDTDWTDLLAGVDGVVHLAARVHVLDERAADPITAFRRVNTEGTRRLAEAAAASGIRRFVYVSSIKAVCDECCDEPIRDATPAAPHSPYGISKREGERALADVAAKRGLHEVVLRPPLVYGPGVGGNFRSLLKLARFALPLPLGALSNRRSLLYVGNLADAIATAIEGVLPADPPHVLCDGPAWSTPDLLRRLACAMHRPSRLVPVPPSLLRAGAAAFGFRGLHDRVAGSLEIDDTGFRTAYGWTPPVSADDALARTARAFMNGGENAGRSEAE